MYRIKRLVLASLAAIAAVAVSPAALADRDSTTDVQGGFADVMNKTKGVVLRVPINARGEENTNAAEVRFYQGTDTVTRATNPEALWKTAIDPGQKRPEVLGTNMPRSSDSSTWGWYSWYGLGWSYPYYYSYYYPTYYYYSSWWYYSYYWNWSSYWYRYYYYYSYW